MIDLAAALAARARTVIRGSHYNDHRREIADRAEAAGEAAPFYYEAALPTQGAERALAEKVMPPFARYLAAKSFDPLRPRGLTVALFLGDLCYLLEPEELV